MPEALVANGVGAVLEALDTDGVGTDPPTIAWFGLFEPMMTNL